MALRSFSSISCRDCPTASTVDFISASSAVISSIFRRASVRPSASDWSGWSDNRSRAAVRSPSVPSGDPTANCRSSRFCSCRNFRMESLPLAFSSGASQSLPRSALVAYFSRSVSFCMALSLASLKSPHSTMEPASSRMVSSTNTTKETTTPLPAELRMAMREGVSRESAGRGLV